MTAATAPRTQALQLRHRAEAERASAKAATGRLPRNRRLHPWRARAGRRSPTRMCGRRTTWSGGRLCG